VKCGWLVKVRVPGFDRMQGFYAFSAVTSRKGMSADHTSPGPATKGPQMGTLIPKAPNRTGDTPLVGDAYTAK
jgi:hypothetical protein